MNRVEGIRYVSGDPLEWADWLAPGDIVTLETEPKALAIMGEGGQAQVGWDQISAIHLEPAQRHVWYSREPVEQQLATRMPLALINLGTLTALPRRSYDRLIISGPSGQLVFDVRNRYWAEEELLKSNEAHALAVTNDFGVFLKDSSYRWVHVKRFRPDMASWNSPSEALRLLLANPAYWDGYTSAAHPVTPGVHGPYRLEAVTPDLFEAVEPEAAQALLDAWLNQYEPVALKDIRGDLTAVRHMIDDADNRFHLQDLGKQAHHDTGWILHSGFLELVLVGPGHTIGLMVASGD